MRTLPMQVALEWLQWIEPQYILEEPANDNGERS